MRTIHPNASVTKLWLACGLASLSDAAVSTRPGSGGMTGALGHRYPEQRTDTVGKGGGDTTDNDLAGG
jgi:hypothetical protein